MPERRAIQLTVEEDEALTITIAINIALALSVRDPIEAAARLADLRKVALVGGLDGYDLLANLRRRICRLAAQAFPDTAGVVAREVIEEHRGDLTPAMDEIRRDLKLD